MRRKINLQNITSILIKQSYDYIRSEKYDLKINYNKSLFHIFLGEKFIICVKDQHSIFTSLFTIQNLIDSTIKHKDIWQTKINPYKKLHTGKKKSLEVKA